jgi:uncharacterized membrane protein (UPF0127 family)
MLVPNSGYAFNRTRNAYLATDLAVADTHWSRFVGLMGTQPANFRSGNGLWIVPCRGVHTMAMNFPIDVIYLDSAKNVVHLEHSLKPWRVARVSMKAASVLELPADTLNSSATSLGDQIEIAIGESAKAAVR